MEIYGKNLLDYARKVCLNRSNDNVDCYKHVSACEDCSVGSTFQPFICVDERRSDSILIEIFP